MLTLPLPLPSTFPSHHVSDVFRLLCFIGLNVLWAWNNTNVYVSNWGLCGWLTIANGGLCLLMAARNNLFATVTRVPSTILLMYHRWTGLATVVHSTIHFVMVSRPWLTTPAAKYTFENRRIQVGIMAWCSLCIIAITSFSLIRRKWFEAFYYAHFVFLAFVIGGLIHASHGPEFLLPGLILWVVDRFIRLASNFRSVQIADVVQYQGEVIKLKIRGIKSSDPGKIVWIQIPDVSFWNWHPFTLAPARVEDEIAVAIRGLGGYTRRLQLAMHGPRRQRADESQQSKPPRIRVDGPYGVGRLQWGVYGVAVLVAGGIGIVPGLSIASYIMEQARGAGTDRADDQLRHIIHFVWVIKNMEHIQWFKEELKLLKDTSLMPSVRATFDLTIHVTGTMGSDEIVRKDEIALQSQSHAPEPDSLEGPHKLIHGRPNLSELFNNLQERYPNMDTAVSVCGPKSLVRAVRRAAAASSNQSGVFFVEEEIFEF